MLEKTTEINLLYDFYGLLLKPKQRSLLELYFLDDWSLTEIAEHQGVSRQAIFESLKRVQTILFGFEKKLSLLQKHRQRQEWSKEMLKQLEQMPEAKDIVETWIDKWLDID